MQTDARHCTSDSASECHCVIAQISRRQSLKANLLRDNHRSCFNKDGINNFAQKTDTYCMLKEWQDLSRPTYINTVDMVMTCHCLGLCWLFRFLPFFCLTGCASASVSDTTSSIRFTASDTSYLRCKNIYFSTEQHWMAKLYWYSTIAIWIDRMMFIIAGHLLNESICTLALKRLLERQIAASIRKFFRNFFRILVLWSIATFPE